MAGTGQSAGSSCVCRFGIQSDHVAPQSRQRLQVAAQSVTPQDFPMVGKSMCGNSRAFVLGAFSNLFATGRRKARYPKAVHIVTARSATGPFGADDAAFSIDPVHTEPRV